MNTGCDSSFFIGSSQAEKTTGDFLRVKAEILCTHSYFGFFNILLAHEIFSEAFGILMKRFIVINSGIANINMKINFGAHGMNQFYRVPANKFMCLESPFLVHGSE